jgi:hypothetical protein
VEDGAMRVKRKTARFNMTKRRTRAWLSDEALERTEALGREMLRFLVRRRRKKQADPRATIRIGSRLREIIARLEREEAAAWNTER